MTEKEKVMNNEQIANIIAQEIYIKSGLDQRAGVWPQEVNE